MSKVSPPAKTPDELKGCTAQLCGVLDQVPALFLWVVHCEAATRPELRGTMQNAALDSTLLAVRVLDEFLGAGRQMNDDIRASDFPGFSSPGTGFLAESDRTEVNKHVAHMTTIRANTLEKRWQIDRLAIEACEAIKPFFEYLLSPVGAPYRDPNFRFDERLEICQRLALDITAHHQASHGSRAPQQ